MYSFAGVESTRKLISCYAADNQNELEAYDDSATWTDPEATAKSHTVIGKQLKFDPYEGNYIDEYIFTLDDGIRWKFNWFIYEKNQLNIQENDSIEIMQVSDDERLMILPLINGENIIIKFKSCVLRNCFITYGNT